MITILEGSLLGGLAAALAGLLLMYWGSAILLARPKGFHVPYLLHPAGRAALQDAEGRQIDERAAGYLWIAAGASLVLCGLLLEWLLVVLLGRYVLG